MVGRPPFQNRLTMPFTFAHPAVILPIVYRWPVNSLVTGLVIGSLAPDFEYFVSLRLTSLGAHSIPGIFYFCLPVCTLMGVLWYFVVSWPLLQNSPVFIRSRFCRNLGAESLSFKFLLLYLVGAILGSFSHILWDSFTHGSGYLVQHWPLLRAVWFRVPVYKILQHASTLLGLIGIIFCIYRMPRQETAGQFSWSFWLTFAGLLLLTFSVITLAFPIGFSFNALGNIIVRLISASFLALIAVSLIFRRRPELIDI